MRRRWIWIVGVVGLVINVVIAAAILPVVYLPASMLLNVFARSGGPPAPIATADHDDEGPGSLVSATTMPAVTRTILGRGLIAARVLYRSTDGDTDLPTVVSGSVFVPSGTAPAGGWPVVAFAHGTVGIDEPCAPSLSDTLRGGLAVVMPLLQRGFAVALPDYQGLGAVGVHPYPDSRTAGFNLIDAVRALRHTFDGVSTKWAAIGHSQGGGASWSADEQAAAYASELDLVGAVAASPAADVSGFVDKAEQGTLTADQTRAMLLIVESLARLHPDLSRADFRSAAAEKYWNVLSACMGPALYQQAAASKQVQPGDLRPHSTAAANQLRRYLQAWALPQRPLSSPLLVSYGGADTYIDAQWTRDAVERECRQGGQLTIDYQPDGGHADVDLAKMFDWVNDRFAGKAVRNDC